MTTEHVESAPGVTLAVDIHEGAPGAQSLLMIPGLGSTRRVYASLIPLLLPTHRVVVYDPRGVGESTMDDPPWTLETLGNDAAAVIRAVADGRADVFGASMGGVVAQHLALDSPDVVRRLVLAATTPGGPRAVERNTFARDRLLGRGAKTPEDAYRLACTVLYSPQFRAEHPEFIEAEISARGRNPISARAFSAQAAASFGHDESARLPHLAVPTLVMHGTDDVVMPFANAQLLAAIIPAAKHAWFDGMGHLFFHEDPVATAAAINSFLS